MSVRLPISVGAHERALEPVLAHFLWHHAPFEPFSPPIEFQPMFSSICWEDILIMVRYQHHFLFFFFFHSLCSRLMGIVPTGMPERARFPDRDTVNIP